MSNEWYGRPQRSPWALLLTIAVLVGAVGVATWWLESRFGAGVALMILGGLVGVVCVLVGILLSAAVQKFTMTSAAQFNANLAAVEQARTQTHRAELGIYREYARGEREAFGQRAKLDMVDRQEVQRLARQQARLLADAELDQARRRQEQDQRQSWSGQTVDGDFTFYE